jgi:hypothetical protein
MTHHVHTRSYQDPPRLSSTTVVRLAFTVHPSVYARVYCIPNRSTTSELKLEPKRNGERMGVLA